MKLSEYAKRNDLTYRGAFNHWKQGLLKGYQLPTGTIVVQEDRGNRDYCIYCRVSSHDQKEDLKRQVERLKDFCSSKGWVVKRIYSEIASGLNDNRKEFNKALNSDNNIVVEHKDRASRFGFNYLKQLLNLLGREIIVINEVENNNDLMQDFISVITSFCARIYGKRRSDRKKKDILKALK